MPEYKYVRTWHQVHRDAQDWADDLPHDFGPAVKGGDVQRGHVVLALLVEVSLAGDEALHACEVVALHRLDHVHTQLTRPKKKDKNRKKRSNGTKRKTKLNKKKRKLDYLLRGTTAVNRTKYC